MTPPSIYAKAASYGHNPENIPPEDEPEDDTGIEDEATFEEEKHSETDDMKGCGLEGQSSSDPQTMIHNEYMWHVPDKVNVAIYIALNVNDILMVS